jgi:transcriptional regulator with AAA-type ATPase domain
MADLVSRAYQEELAQYAREHNAILVAETGTGKTLIATMVLKWKMACERISQPDDASATLRKVCCGVLIPVITCLTIL